MHVIFSLAMMLWNVLSCLLIFLPWSYYIADGQQGEPYNRAHLGEFNQKE